MASGLKGVDVSQHQGSVDWQKVTGAGFDFAIVKSSEGQDFIDPADGSKSDPNDRRLERLRARCVEIREHGLTLGVDDYLWLEGQEDWRRRGRAGGQRSRARSDGASRATCGSLSTSRRR